MFDIDKAFLNALKFLINKDHPFLRPHLGADGVYFIPTLMLVEATGNKVLELVSEKDATIKEVAQSIAMGVDLLDFYQDLIYYACDPVVCNYLLVLKAVTNPFQKFLKSWYNGDVNNGDYEKSKIIYTLTDDRTDDRVFLIDYINKLFINESIEKTSISDFIILTRLKEILSNYERISTNNGNLEKNNTGLLGNHVYSSTLEISSKMINGEKLFDVFSFNLLITEGDDLHSHLITSII